jgi:hypothetical protein
MTKIIVFDLDETLGYFTELGYFLDCLGIYLKRKDITQEQFNNIMDLYPEFLRPKIIPILTYLKYQKQNGYCEKIMIYTNNNGPQIWAQRIVAYFESKLNCKLFDQIISAFKVEGKQLEMCRTTHDKHYHDLMKCTKLPQNAEIFFLDDSLHPQMLHNSVYYIHVDPYYYMLPFEEMMSRFKFAAVGKELISDDLAEFDKVMKSCWTKSDFEYVRKQMREYRLEKIMSKQIMMLLQKFFSNTLTKNENRTIVPMNAKTRRRRLKGKKRNKTSHMYY